MVECNESPVGHNTGYALLALVVLTDDKVFHRGSIHHYDIRESENLGENGRCEEGSMLDDDKGTFILERNPEFGEEPVGGLTDDLESGTWGES